MLRIFTAFLVALSLFSCGDDRQTVRDTVPPDHSKWSLLLSKHVNKNGMVNYLGFQKDRLHLNSYLKDLAKNPPSQVWSDREQLAYWINAYNAFTIDLILSNYPLSSIKEIGPGIQVPFINSPWDIEFIEIGGEKYDLNDIEHNILRKEFKEPRIHFAINCASMSCPLLRSEAYTSEKLESQLQEQAFAFLNDPFRNQITKSEVKISKIFNWFRGDFIKDGKLIDYLNKYSEVEVNSNARIKYLDYDWKLNQSTD